MDKEIEMFIKKMIKFEFEKYTKVILKEIKELLDNNQRKSARLCDEILKKGFSSLDHMIESYSELKTKKKTAKYVS